MKKIKLAIFASGSGSNAKNIINYFDNHSSIEVSFVLSNKSDAPIVNWCRENNVKVIVLSNDEVNNGQLLIQTCTENQISSIILAGYLRKIPSDFIQHFEEKIINIHPSLLPKFGGQGMYGIHVHRAVKDANEIQSGITIHYINENFDEGRHLAQFYCRLSSADTVETIQHKIQQLEHDYFPLVIEKTLLNELL